MPYSSDVPRCEQCRWQDADRAGTIAIGHQIFAHNPDCEGQLTQVRREAYRVPETAQVFATPGAWAGFDELHVGLARMAGPVITREGLIQ